MTHMKELLKRGLSFFEANMLCEAISSCAIEGVKQPQTKKDYDKLVALLRKDD